MIIERLTRLFVTPPHEPAVAVLTGAETDALFYALGCDTMPVYIPAEVWQRVTDMAFESRRV